jgi:hypothetical protein
MSPKETPIAAISTLWAGHCALHTLAIDFNSTQEAAAAGAASLTDAVAQHSKPRVS